MSATSHAGLAITSVRDEIVAEAGFSHVSGLLVLSNYSGGDNIARVPGRRARLCRQGHAPGTPHQSHPCGGRRRAYMPDELAGRYARPIQSQLSDREADVLKLIAKGLSNKEIAPPSALSKARCRYVAYIRSKLHVATVPRRWLRR